MAILNVKRSAGRALVLLGMVGSLMVSTMLCAPPADAHGTGGPRGKWSELPECDLQYEQDIVYCNRFHKKKDAAKCRAIQNERLAYCTRTQGKTGHPARYKADRDD